MTNKDLVKLVDTLSDNELDYMARLSKELTMQILKQWLTDMLEEKAKASHEHV